MHTPANPLPPLTPVICGPTAGGKSDLAVQLALALRDKHAIPAQIVTADAFQVYTGLDIGTAKPTAENRRGIPHHLIDIVPGMSDGRCRMSDGSNPAPSIQHPGLPSHPTSDIQHPTSAFTLDTWLAHANHTIADLRARHILPIVVGGTHLYIKALLDGLFEGPKADDALRAELSAMDPAARRAELERVDPIAAQRIHPNDIRRTIRALEVFRLTGRPISDHQTQWDQGASRVSERCSLPTSPPSALSPPTSPFLLVILDWNPDALNRRINFRVKHMMDRGLLDEVRSLLLASAFTPQSAEALGYKQLIPVVKRALDHAHWPPPERDVEAAVEKIKIETRRFGKNQRTWLRRLSATPGALRLSAPEDPQSGDPSWLNRILHSLGLPS